MPAPGMRVGSYEVVAPIGKGGMGEVWRGRDDRLGRDVALKFVAAAGADRLARFEHEARTLAALNHPNICVVYDVGPDFIAMELVDGAPLLPDPQRSVRALVDLAVQIADGLAAAHSAGIVHRDLKPDNVLVTRDGRVKIVDFGLAKSLGATSSDGVETQATGRTHPGTILGTVAYMSPEQARGDRVVDTRSDQFSFGLILYELLAGRRAFKRETAAETLSAIIREDPPPLPQGVPAPLRWIVDRCLAKEPQGRYDTTRGLYLELSHLRDHVSELTGPDTGVMSPLRARRWPKALGMAAAALLVAAAGYAVRHYTGRAESVSPPRYRRVTFRDGAISSSLISPDGRTVVYKAQWAGEPQRWYRTELSTGGTETLDVPPETDVLGVSSKGDLALLSPTPGRGDGTLSRRPLSGGAARELLKNVYAADWGPDGQRLAVAHVVEGSTRIEYPIGTVLHEEPAAFLHLQVSPDGARVACTTWSAGGAAILMVSTSREVSRIPLRGNAVPVVSWSPDGTEVWFSSADPSEAGAIKAYALDGSRRDVTAVVGGIHLTDVASNGLALLVSETGRTVLNVRRADGTTRDLAWLGQAAMPVLSDDGRNVVFTEVGEGGGPEASVYLRATDGSPPVRLGTGLAHAITADGRWVGVTRGIRHFMVPTGAGAEHAFPVGDVLVGGLPDRRSFVIAHVEPSKPSRCDIWESDTDARRELVTDGCDDPQLSSDATRLIYRGQDGRWRWRFLAHPSVRIASGLGDQEAVLRWSRQGPWVYTLPRPNAREIWKVNVESAARHVWKPIDPAAEFSLPLSSRYLSITPDGDAWVYVRFRGNGALYVGEGVR